VECKETARIDIVLKSREVWSKRIREKKLGFVKRGGEVSHVERRNLKGLGVDLRNHARR